MIISGLNKDYNKVCTKEELKELLKKYKGILTSPMLDYLESLIELEFSVVRSYITDSDREALAELEIYKKTAIYNIYNRIINLLNENKINAWKKYEGLDSLSISIPLNEKQNVEVFNFDYKEEGAHSMSQRIPSGYKTMNIGTISLYQTMENKELRSDELNRILNTLEKLYDARNPYPSRPGVVGGPGAQWAFEHAQKIQEYEKKLEEIDGKILSDDDKKEIEIKSQIHDMLLKDYDLTNESFKEEKEKSIFRHEKSILHKTLVKTMPNLTIKDEIKYI